MPARQQELFRHGGKRRGAGRPAKGPRPSERHKRRERFRASEPVHVTLRVADDVRALRTRDLYRAIRWATIAVAYRQDDEFRIVHASVQYVHVHLICEASDQHRLARGIQGFAGSAAKRINAAASHGRSVPRRGAVFPDRYHVRILKSPTQTRRAVSYVLNNWRHHGLDRGRASLVDPFSSGISFAGWRELDGAVEMWKAPPDYEALWVWLPRTWLLSQGWQRAGRISARDIPGGKL